MIADCGLTADLIETVIGSGRGRGSSLDQNQWTDADSKFQDPHITGSGLPIMTSQCYLGTKPHHFCFK